MVQLISWIWLLHQNLDSLLPITKKYHNICSIFTHPRLATRQYNVACDIYVLGCYLPFLSFVNVSGTLFDTPHKVQIYRIATPKPIMAELWNQRIGHRGPSQLSSAAAQSFGTSPKLSSKFHPIHWCRVCSDAKSTIFLQLTLRISYHFGFIHANSENSVYHKDNDLSHHLMAAQHIF